jgi:hypothetical protein
MGDREIPIVNFQKPEVFKQLSRPGRNAAEKSTPLISQDALLSF